MYFNNLKKLTYLLLIFFPYLLVCQSSRACQKAVNKFATDEALTGCSMSIALLNADNGKMMASWDEKRKLIPASTLKLITCATAVKQLGSEFTYQTIFSLRGDFFQDSIFIGDIYIEGMADPSFGSENFKETKTIEAIADTLAILLKKNLVKEIVGRVIVNSTFIKDIPENPEWLYYDVANYYGAGVFGFNFLENTSYLQLEKDSLTNQYSIGSVFPKELVSIFQNKIQSSNIISPDDEEIFFLGSSQCKHLTLNGCLPENAMVNISVKSAIPDPPRTYETILMNQLRVRGIVIEENSRRVNRATIRPLYNHASPTLPKMIQYTLKNSVNLYCESFVHLLGYSWFGNTQRSNALHQIEKYWNNLLPEYCKIKMVDGSGLSRKNRINAEAMCLILKEIYRDQQTCHFDQLMYNASESGSLAVPLSKQKTLQGKWLLKSGSMQGIRSYSGYVQFEQSTPYIFSIILNNYDCSSKEIANKIAVLISKLDQALKPK